MINLNAPEAAGSSSAPLTPVQKQALHPTVNKAIAQAPKMHSEPPSLAPQRSRQVVQDNAKILAERRKEMLRSYTNETVAPPSSRTKPLDALPVIWEEDEEENALKSK